MSKIKDDIIKEFVRFKDLKTSHYRIILWLMVEKETTQSNYAEKLEIQRQNVNRAFKDLQSMDIITISRVEGKNIYWKLNTNPTFQIRGQQTFNTKG